VVKGFMGNYSQYKDYLDAKQREERKEKSAQKKEEPKPVKQREKVKRSFKEQREYENLTKEMADLEAEKQALTEALNSETDYQKLQEMGNRLQDIKNLLDEKELRWLELDEIEG
jgi:ATP-binding cassette subfamily F protein uup